MPAAATAADLMRRIGLYVDSRRDIAVRHALALVEAGLGADPDGSSARVLGAISNAGPYDVTAVRRLSSNWRTVVTLVTVVTLATAVTLVGSHDRGGAIPVPEGPTGQPGGGGWQDQALLVPVGSTDEQVLAWASEFLTEAAVAELREITNGMHGAQRAATRRERHHHAAVRQAPV